MLRILLICAVMIRSISLLSEEVDLSIHEKSVYSKDGEDGILSKIFQLIKPTSRFYVDLGAGNGKSYSSTYLLHLQGWKGLSLDRSYEISSLRLYKEFITAENVNNLFEKYQIPLNFDLLCIDLHYNDFHIWNAIDNKYKPSLVLIGYNATHLPSEDKVVKYRPYFCGDLSNNYFGASILAMCRLGQSKGYSLIYAENSGAHLFFILDEVLQKANISFKNSNNVEKIYRIPTSGPGPNGGWPQDSKNREYFTSIDITTNSSHQPNPAP